MRHSLVCFFFAVIVPILLIAIDPGVLNGNLSLFSRWSPFSYVVLYIAMAAYCWSHLPPVTGRLASFQVGLLRAGIVVAVFIGMGLLLITVGLLFIGIGVIGLLPFVTALAYHARARHVVGKMAGDRHLPAMAAGFVFPLVLGLSVWAWAEHQTQTGLAQVASGKPEAVQTGFDKLERANWVAYRRYERKLAFDLATGAIPCSNDCAERFRALTGCHPVAYGFTGSDARKINPVIPHTQDDKWCAILLGF